MELFDAGQGPQDLIEMANEQLEVSDLPPGDLGLLVLPGSAVPTAFNADDSDEKETTWENDQDHAKFVVYLKQKLDNIPRHSGNTTVGCEKAIAFLKRLDREISKAVQSDEKNVIDEEEAEALRDTIMEFVAQLEEAHGKLLGGKKSNKKASVWVGKEVVARLNDGVNIQYFLPVVRDEVEELLPVAVAEPTDEQVQLFVKGEGTSTDKLRKDASTAKIMLYVDPFMQAVTRIMMNAHVSAGRNIEDVYAHLDKKYNFTAREALGIQETLLQKGMPIFKDFGRMGEEVIRGDGKEIEFLTTYPGV